MNSAPNTVFRQLSEKVLFDVLAFAGDRELESLRKVSPEVSRIIDLIKGENSFLLILSCLIKSFWAARADVIAAAKMKSDLARAAGFVPNGNFNPSGSFNPNAGGSSGWHWLKCIAQNSTTLNSDMLIAYSWFYKFL